MSSWTDDDYVRLFRVAQRRLSALEIACHTLLEISNGESASNSRMAATGALDSITIIRGKPPNESLSEDECSEVSLAGALQVAKIVEGNNYMELSLRKLREEIGRLNEEERKWRGLAIQWARATSICETALQRIKAPGTCGVTDIASGALDDLIEHRNRNIATIVESSKPEISGNTYDNSGFKGFRNLANGEEPWKRRLRLLLELLFSQKLTPEQAIMFLDDDNSPCAREVK